MRKIINQEGQSLLELIIALSVLVITITATVVLIVTSINAGRESRNKLIATSLAREGIEIVRNIRDSNWIDPTNVGWSDGLAHDTSGDTAVPIIDNNNPITLNFTDVDEFSDEDWTRLTEQGGYYLQSGSLAGNSQFYRLIKLEAICRDSSDDSESFVADTNTTADDCGSLDEVGVRIMVEVRWPKSDSNKEVIIEDRLYDWSVL